LSIGEEMKEEKRTLKKRLFLNSDPELSAFLKFNIGYILKKHRNGYTYQSLDAELSMSDCDRIIRLEFDAYSENGKKEINDRIKKALRLKENINLFVDEYIKSAEKYRDMIPKIKAHNNKLKTKNKKDIKSTMDKVEAVLNADS